LIASGSRDEDLDCGWVEEASVGNRRSGDIDRWKYGKRRMRRRMIDKHGVDSRSI
jgi:hypothetical protein